MTRTRFDVVVPARDEAGTLPALLPVLKRCASRVIVCDSASSDGTGEAAALAGVDVLRLDRPGKGHAVAAGLQASAANNAFVCDADIAGLSETQVDRLMNALDRNDAPLARLVLGRPVHTAPVTMLAARPLLHALGVDLREPLGGIVGVRRTHALDLHLPGGWGFDVAMSLLTIESGARVLELESAGIEHREKPLNEYVEMAGEVVAAILRARGLVPWDHSDCVRCAPATAEALAESRLTARV